MRFLVAYASRYGATQGIARRLAARLTAAGHEVDLRPVTEAGDPGNYEAVVLGSAVYLGHWRKAAVAFVQRHRQALATRPVWLFSSGPLPAITEPGASDLPIVAEPAELAAVLALIAPRDYAVFAGALTPDALSLRDRLIREIPGVLPLLPAGDFRDWAAIDVWGDGIARAATSAPRAHTVGGGSEPANCKLLAGAA